jgi:hypothetical protein
MERIYYAGNTVRTGSAIAHALLGYAQALANDASSAAISIPTMHDDGTVVQAEILIGPASQLITEEDPWDGPELEDAEVVAQLSSATAALAVVHPMPVEDAEFAAVDAIEIDAATRDLETQ